MNLVIPDGVKEIGYDTFRSSTDLKHLFIPASVSDIYSSWNDISNGEILYYGGSEKQWHKVTENIRSNIPFKKIIYEATSEDCISNIHTIVEDTTSMGENQQYTPLSDFEYDVVDNRITLEEYVGHDTIVNISPKYYVDGNLCQVIALKNTFTSTTVRTIIIPEGVMSLSDFMFDNSSTDQVYLPTTLVDLSDAFWDHIHVNDTIYFGGTKEEFDALCPIDRFDIDVKHMVYEASPEDILIKQDE